MAPTSVDALFYMASSLIHTQFAYATVNHDKKPCSNNEQPNSQRKSSSGFTRDLRVKVTPCVQTRLLLDGVSIARYDHTSITHEN